MSRRFYTKEGTIAEGATLPSAKKAGHLISVTTLLDEVMKNEGLMYYRDMQVVRAAYSMPKFDWTEDDCAIPITTAEWEKRVLLKADEHRKQAAEFGSGVHDAIEKYLNGQPCENHQGYIEASKEWFSKNIQKVIATEQVLVSKLGFAGRCDCVARMMDGRLAVLDFKCQGMNGKAPNW